MLYSGVSNLLTGGSGWGFFKSLTGKGGNTQSIGPGGSSGGSSGGGTSKPPSVGGPFGHIGPQL